MYTNLIHRRRKGFTIVELVIVIAVIAILSAILIPTFTGVVTNAKLAKDKAQAANMNTSLAIATATSGGTADLTAVEIRTIFSSEYSFVCETPNYLFWFDQTDHTIKVGKDPGSSGVVFADGFNTSDTAELEEVIPGKLVLSTGGTPLAEALYGIRNLKNTADFTTLKGKLAKYDTTLTTFVDKFNPSTTLYIGETGGVTNSTTNITKIVFADGLRTIPAVYISPVTLTAEVEIPSTIQLIERSALTSVNVSGTGKITAKTTNISVENNSLSLELKQSSSLPAEGSNALKQVKVYTKNGENAAVECSYNVLNKISSGSNFVVEINSGEVNKTYSLVTKMFENNGTRYYSILCYDSYGSLYAKTTIMYIIG